MNDNEREQWVDNDEGLYCRWRMHGGSKRAYVRAHRAEIDAAIENVTSGKKPAHYLGYGDGRITS